MMATQGIIIDVETIQARLTIQKMMRHKSEAKRER